MAISMIRQKLGSKTLTMYVPAKATAAKAFADAVLDGKIRILEKTSETGSDTANTGRYVNAMVQDETTQSKAYLKFIIASTKHEGDVINALQGKTFNGVKADKVVIIGMQSAEF